MATAKNFLKLTKNDSFKKTPFCEADFLVLTALSYADFKNSLYFFILESFSSRFRVSVSKLRQTVHFVIRMTVTNKNNSHCFSFLANSGDNIDSGLSFPRSFRVVALIIPKDCEKSRGFRKIL